MNFNNNARYGVFASASPIIKVVTDPENCSQCNETCNKTEHSSSIDKGAESKNECIDGTNEPKINNEDKNIGKADAQSLIGNKSSGSSIHSTTTDDEFLQEIQNNQAVSSIKCGPFTSINTYLTGSKVKIGDNDQLQQKRECTVSTKVTFQSQSGEERKSRSSSRSSQQERDINTSRSPPRNRKVLCNSKPDDDKQSANVNAEYSEEASSFLKDLSDLHSMDKHANKSVVSIKGLSPRGVFDFYDAGKSGLKSGLSCNESVQTGSLSSQNAEKYECDKKSEPSTSIAETVMDISQGPSVDLQSVSSLTNKPTINICRSNESYNGGKDTGKINNLPHINSQQHGCPFKPTTENYWQADANKTTIGLGVQSAFWGSPAMGASTGSSWNAPQSMREETSMEEGGASFNTDTLSTICHDLSDKLERTFQQLQFLDQKVERIDQKLTDYRVATKKEIDEKIGSLKEYFEGKVTKSDSCKTYHSSRTDATAQTSIPSIPEPGDVEQKGIKLFASSEREKLDDDCFELDTSAGLDKNTLDECIGKLRAVTDSIKQKITCPVGCFQEVHNPQEKTHQASTNNCSEELRPAMSVASVASSAVSSATLRILVPDADTDLSEENKHITPPHFSPQTTIPQGILKQGAVRKSARLEQKGILNSPNSAYGLSKGRVSKRGNTKKGIRGNRAGGDESLVTCSSGTSLRRPWCAREHSRACRVRRALAGAGPVPPCLCCLPEQPRRRDRSSVKLRKARDASTRKNNVSVRQQKTRKTTLKKGAAVKHGQRGSSLRSVKNVKNLKKDKLKQNAKKNDKSYKIKTLGVKNKKVTRSFRKLPVKSINIKGYNKFSSSHSPDYDGKFRLTKSGRHMLLQHLLNSDIRHRHHTHKKTTSKVRPKHDRNQSKSSRIRRSTTILQAAKAGKQPGEHIMKTRQQQWRRLRLAARSPSRASRASLDRGLIGKDSILVNKKRIKRSREKHISKVREWMDGMSQKDVAKKIAKREENQALDNEDDSKEDDRFFIVPEQLMRKLMSAFISSNQVCRTDDKRSNFRSRFEEEINNTLSNLSQGDTNYNKCFYLTQESDSKKILIEKQTTDLLTYSHHHTVQNNSQSICSLIS